MPVASRSRHRRALVAAGVGALLLAACGGSGSDGTAKVATLQSSDAASATTTTVATAANTQEAWLSLASCMRENGVDMADPTFDADGNVQGGFGPGSGIDFRDENVRTAIEACQQYMDAVRPQGAGPGGNQADREARQAALVAFTSCLRDNGLQVDDITFGGGPGDGAPPAGQGGQGGGTTGSTTAGGGAGAPPGGFTGSRPERPADGQGFDPTDRILERLGLDKTDPAVTKALEACQSQLEAAFTRPGATTTTTKP